MELVIRAAAIYIFLVIILRVSGKRQFSEITTFDFVLLLIISEAVSQGLYGSADYSLIASVILVSTLIAIDILLSYAKRMSPLLEGLIESKPTILVRDGQLVEENMKGERVDEADILSAARLTFGLDGLDQIRHAVLEVDGSISVIPEARTVKLEQRGAST
jgi:uncharacterized membrane protein YcaP (DUF421 family)